MELIDGLVVVGNGKHQGCTYFVFVAVGVVQKGVVKKEYFVNGLL